MEKPKAKTRGYYSEIVTGTSKSTVKPRVALLATVPRKTQLTWQIPSEQHSATVKDLKVQKTYNFLGEAKRWMTFPEDRSIAFPAETFAPKVQMERSVEPRRLSRNVEMERRRRIYRNLRTEDALDATGVSPDDMLPPTAISPMLSHEEKYGLFATAHFLPLEIFDDEEYDCRTIDDWLNLGVVDGTRHPLPATAFVETELEDRKTRPFAWCLAAVTGHDRRMRLWHVVTLDGRRRMYCLSRIYVRFFAEDPRIFAARVAKAVELRKLAEDSIKYNFYLDCMEVEGTLALSEEQKEIIIKLCFGRNGAKIKEDRIADLIEEISLDYQRTMCDLLWRRLINHNPEMFKFITSTPVDDVMHVPRAAKVDTGTTKFAETKRHSHWSSLYVLPEVYEAMRCVVGECIRASHMSLFASNHGRSMSLTEFAALQSQTALALLKYLKEPWLGKIAQSVRMCLRDVGKGWYDLAQRSHDVYDVMKLKRFMGLATLRMQNALRMLVEMSMEHYVKFLEAPATCCRNVEEDFVWGDNLVDTQFQCYNPIFNVNIMMNEKEAFYSTSPHLFEETIVSLFDSALESSHQVRQVHPFLLQFLKFPSDLYLSSVGLLEGHVSAVRSRLRRAYQKSAIPLKAYAAEYRKYLGLFKLDVAQYIEEFKNEDHTASKTKEEISFQIAMEHNLASTLPSEISIGPFHVNVRPLKGYLVQKHQDCSVGLLRMFTGKLRSQLDEILEGYTQIRQKLRETPKSVEEVFEICEWMETIPLTVRGLDDATQRLKMDYEILDTFWWNLSDDDFQAKWEAVGYPRQIGLQIEETSARLLEEEDKFSRIQVQDEILLLERIDTLVGNVANIALQTDVGRVHETALEARRVWRAMKESQELGLLLNERQKLLGMAVVPFERLNKLLKEFEAYNSLWVSASDWYKWHEIWMENPLMNIDGNQIEGMVAEMHKVMSRCVKTFQENPKVAAIASTVREQIEEFRPYVGMIQALRDPGMKPRHFDELSARTGIQMSLTPALTFKNLIVVGVMEFAETVRSVAEAAAKEYAIEGTLTRMIDDWETITMDVLQYKTTGTYIMKIADETSVLLDDHILGVQQLTFSPYKAAFEESIGEWEYKLKLSQEVILLWAEVQKQWMYLEPIFISEDISRQLPVETRKFNTMERNWRRIMKSAYDNPYIIRVCPDKSLLESLKESLTLLELVQKGLSDYLETKRTVFPRFYFLSDDELLEIVAQTKNVRAVQPHLKKCFENMRELRFEEDLLITRMYSAEYEEVELRPAIYPEGNVEDWLGQVERAMRNTLREIIRDALRVVESLPRKEWVYMWPGQVVLCSGQTHWTARVERGIEEDGLSRYYQLLLSQLDDLRDLVRGPQTEIQRLMLEAVITIEVHARDVLHRLIRNRVSNVNDFEWISQLRYYWIDDTDLVVRAVNAEFPYGYEYLGNNGRLVITPLTDRCYVTLTGALRLKFGGAPAGPAGTGKTETTKDLAKALGIQCVVFNCSDQLDFMSMGKFFKGLASAGAWACFDEFNRIDIEVLSVIAQQIMTIQKAQQIRAEVFLFEGMEIALRPSCAVFITMNPGYAGRTELPDNLKALFRPVAMMVPNYALIAEISLFSYGFAEAGGLAGKITSTFKLSSEQLSTQDHYDFGMRSVKTVIAVAGNLKREQKDLSEQQICLRALRDVNVPKLLKDDLKLFNGIVSDLFPGLKEEPVDYGTLETQIRKSTLQLGLEDVDEFVKKVIQLYETTLVRHGLMLVGPTGSGKTKCYTALQDACTRLRGQAQPSGRPYATVLAHVLNPKSVTMGQLYGEYDLDTHEWTDGILPKLLRDGINATDQCKRWYVFDGPVDAVWIENMNTVLDDNKKLCLTSGEIMKLLPTQTMIFEVADLRVASPATVSRCGMVYMEPESLGIEPFIDCWIKSLPPTMTEYAERLGELTRQFVLPGLKFLRGNLSEIVGTVDCGLMRSYMNLMDFRIGPMAGREGKAPPDYAFQRLIPDLLSPWTAFAAVWSLGASCEHEGRRKFSEWLRDVQKRHDHPLPFPDDGLVYDYRLHDGGFTDAIDTQEPAAPRWCKWLDNIPSVAITPEMKYADIEVPTTDSVRNAALIGYLLVNGSNVLCVGPTGSGKTLTVTAKLTRDMPKKYICDFITFSARTTANQTQDIIDGKLEKRRMGVFGPTVMKKQVLFIDDLNMPSLDAYGAQPAIELIRQFMDFRGWYDRREVGAFRLIEDVNFIGAMGPPGGGRNPITVRLLRHFHLTAFPDMEEDAKSHIFGTILRSWLSNIPDLENLFENVVRSTLTVYRTICSELLPTPDKSHYTFNLRDLSKIFQGILMMRPERIQNREELFNLWYHENLRVFCDRLVNDVDRAWFDGLLRCILKESFDCNSDLVIGVEALFYGDFCSNAKEYERMADFKKIEKILEEFLEDYNGSTTSPMKLVLFHDAIDHICRISRILRQPRGNALLLGMGGSGRQSLTKLSARIREYTCFQIEISRAYTIQDWRNDIKNLMLKAGLENQVMVFLFSDTQIKRAAMLEDLNGILSGGDVPNIYEQDETERVQRAMRGPVQEAGLQINRSNLYAAYVRLVRNNLHTVITMSPIGEVFRSRIRQFPALVNCCTIDWFSSWPDVALQSVARRFLSGIRDESVSEEVLVSIVRTCQYMHSSVIEASDRYARELDRQNYVTPTSYLELLSSYGGLLRKKKNGLLSARTRLSTGLGKLASTESEVKDMQRTLKSMRPDLERAAEATAKMIQRINKDRIEAEKTKARAKEQEEAAAKLKLENKQIRDEAEADLSEVKPMLDAAELSLKALNKSDITEIKAMKRPPVGVLLVIEAICIVNNVKPHKLPGKLPGEKILDYWTPGSQMLTDPGHFLSTMEKYRKEDITEEMINKLKDYVDNPNFQPLKVLQVSKACHSLCLWVHAMYNYYFVSLRVAPKMEALSRAEAALSETEKTLAVAMSRLKDVEAGVQRLEESLRQEQDRRAELERQRQLCEDRMSRAVRLIAGLADERRRWISLVAEMDSSLKNAIGDILLSAGAVAYLTPFVDSYREALLSSWADVLGAWVPHTPGGRPVTILGDQMEIRKWQLEGLPRDGLSVENAVLVTHSNRWPLFVDPQGQANRWIRNMCKPIGLSVARMTDRDILRVLESCVRFGKPCLVENVGTEIEAGLDPILTLSLFRHGGQLCVKIGDNVVPYNHDFKLYLATRLPNPRYTPEVAVKVLLVNFALTASGLQDQMLSLVTIQERPDLERERNLLIVSNAEMRKELKEIEDRILHRLSASVGSVVDDIDLILTLEASKVKSEEIKAKMEAAEVTGADIETTRSLYIPVARRAQILFFCLSDLRHIDRMYQYSLEWFVAIFNGSILATEKSDDIELRIASINGSFAFRLFANVCRSLFERHKLHFAFLLCARIRMGEGSIGPNEWRHFLSGPLPAKELPNPSPGWITQRCWLEIQALELLPSFDGFVASFQRSLKQFKKIFDAQEAHLEPFPEPWRARLDSLQRMLVLKCLRPDKVRNAMQIYLSEHLGRRFVEPQTTDLSSVYGDSATSTPVVFVLSTGADPAVELHRYADKMKMGKKLHSISLGQGQGPRAEAMMRQSMELGYWVFFQNCHLAPSWMPNLEILVETLSGENIHRDFRLWLTSAPSDDFPVSILQNSSKMTVEPPRGIKANMSRAYFTQVAEMQELLQSEDPKVIAFKWLLFSLCMFHSVLLERRKFGSLGFNIPYEFTEGDLTICISQLHMFLMEYETVPFKVLVYTAGHINYGGRITDDWDRRCVLTILDDYYNPNVLSADYKFDPEGVYHQLSSTAAFPDYVEHVSGLPLNDAPSAFGLHANAEIALGRAETYSRLAALLALQPRPIGAEAAGVEVAAGRTAEDMLMNMPRNYDLAGMLLRYPVMYEESLNTVLVQEAKRYNGLLDAVRSTLKDLVKALSGLVVMSEQLETMAGSLYNNAIPEIWQARGYPSLKPLGAWFDDLRARIEFLKGWEESGIPTSFWISGFYFPQAFLTGTLQNFARKHTVAIDRIDYSFQVLQSRPTQRPSDGCVVYGLFLEGCRWLENRLEESLPKELYTDMPPILLLPEVDHRVAKQGIYQCPVYKTVKRAGTLSTTGHSTNFVLAMEIPSETPEAHWIKRGVALICALDY